MGLDGVILEKYKSYELAHCYIGDSKKSFSKIFVFLFSEKCPSEPPIVPCSATPPLDQCAVSEDCGQLYTCCAAICGNRVCRLNIDPLSSRPLKK